jgi:hypothetical protein
MGMLLYPEHYRLEQEQDQLSRSNRPISTLKPWAAHTTGDISIGTTQMELLGAFVAPSTSNNVDLGTATSQLEKCLCSIVTIRTVSLVDLVTNYWQRNSGAVSPVNYHRQFIARFN